ncbi:hypothetical protein L5515_006475 [Caenorhabditis briggsae]|uniref:DUF38 domain-containing protein n=1 Tax=Caenorhabditis briggsae TaxID=6238 RepID=A0AAE9EZJ2_CAEBR|nr:hypothetical protein L5515_006475 [Caenorhabditis briggsae]
MAEYDAGNFEISWDNLPDWFKRDVVGFLDFKSRRNLRSCSKLCRILVDCCPFFIEKLGFFLSVSRISIYFSTDSRTITKHSYSKNENTFTEVIQDFLRLFQNSKSIVNELTVDFSDLEKSKMVIDEIKKITKENFKIRVKKIIWYSCPNNLSAVQFVNFITVGALETIRFEYQHGNLEMIKRLMETEQWKQAEEITTSTVLPKGLDFEKFSNVKRLKIKVEDSEWDVPKIQNLIMNFKRKNHPVGSFFSILVYFSPKGSEREEEEIPTPIIVDEVKILPKSGHYFRMPNKNHFLRVHRLENGIEGLVRDSNEYIEYFIL